MVRLERQDMKEERYSLERNINKFEATTYDQFFSRFDSYNRKLIGLLQVILDRTPESILDLACGVGHSTAALHSCFRDAKITGVDIDASLIDVAKAALPSSQISFQSCEISELLENTEPNSLDLIFVKSAYHYFEQEITIPYLQRYLKEDGAIVIAERTARSAKSYPLPNIASNYWESVFVEPRPSDRLNFVESSNTSLQVSCYGENIDIAGDAYLEAVRQNQLVGLWMLKQDVINRWIDRVSSQPNPKFSVFEEFWLYVYRNA